MGFWKTLLAALWLDFEAVEKAFWARGVVVRPWPAGLVNNLITAMAYVVSTSTLERIKSLIFRGVRDGENPKKLFSLPIFQESGNIRGLL
jgi:hypothetical protein